MNSLHKEHQKPLMKNDHLDKKNAPQKRTGIEVHLNNSKEMMGKKDKIPSKHIKT